MNTAWCKYFWFCIFCCCSVSQLCLTLCNHMDYSTPGFPVHQNSWTLLKLMSTELVMPSNHLILCCPLLLLPSIFPSIRVFSMSQFFASGGQNIEFSASTSVLPMNIQDWSLVWTGWVSLQSKGLSRVFSNTTVQKHQFFGSAFFIIQLSHSYMTTGETIALTRQTFAGKVMSLLFNMLSGFTTRLLILPVILWACLVPPWESRSFQKDVLQTPAPSSNCG